jgi:hypothetical protein
LSETDTRIDEYTIDQGTLYLHGTYHLNPAIQYFIQNAKITKAAVVWEGPDARFVFAMLSEHAPLQSLTVILNNRTICAAMLDEPWYDFVLPFNEVEHEVDQDGSAFLYYTRAWKELCRITDVDELKITFDQPNGVNWDKGYTCPEMAEAPALENWLRNQFPEGWRPSINERMVVRDQAEQALAARLAASPASATTRKSPSPPLPSPIPIRRQMGVVAVSSVQSIKRGVMETVRVNVASVLGLLLVYRGGMREDFSFLSLSSIHNNSSGWAAWIWNKRYQRQWETNFSEGVLISDD